MSASVLPAHAVAIVGASVRFPGASDLDAYASLLREGREAMRPIDPERLAASAPAELRREPGYVAMQSALDDHDRFDAGFFGYTPREALVLDPQQRKLLECAWHAFEDAGHTPGDGDGRRTAVFSSVALSSYLTSHLLPHLIAGRLGQMEVGLGNDKDFAPTRISYKLDLQGPAVAVQTACSSSLVAAHLACQSLNAGECDLALVVGGSIRFPLDQGYLFSESGIHSRDGRCRPFAEDATGTIFASGAAAVLLRRLDDAVSADDRVLAVIRGSAVNNDGGGRVGFTAPNVDGQSAVIAEALGVADVDPADVDLVETHGTATPLGDPIEFAAMTDAFAANGAPPRGAIALGAVKANLGHLDTTAGLAGLIKVALAFRHGELFPTPHAEKANPALRIEDSPFRLLARGEPWPRGGRPRIAGVSSFGMGGTNAHVIVQEAPEPRPAAPGRTHELLVFSARDAEDCEGAARRLGAFLKNGRDGDLGDVGYTLRHGRRAFPERRMRVARSLQDARDALASGRLHAGRIDGDEPVIGIVLPGQGSQYPGLASDLAAAEPAFAEPFGRLRDALIAAGGPDIASFADRSDDADLVRSTKIAQPLLFAVGVGLGRMFETWGVRGHVFLGQSIGEIGVACLTGGLSEEDACRLVVARSEAMAAAPEGAIVQLAMPADGARELVETVRAQGDGALEVMAMNAPTATLAGGTFRQVDRLIEAAERNGIEAIRLRTSHAFHTSMMESAAAAVGAAVDGVSFSSPQGRILSTLTGDWLDHEGFAATGYWSRQIREPVRFEEAFVRMLSARPALVLELGPPGGLAAYAGTIAAAAGEPAPTVVSVLPSAKAAQDQGADQAAALNALGQVWLAGGAPDWEAFDRPFSPRRRLGLPGYPFKRERHWISETNEVVKPEAAAEAAAEIVLPRQPRPAAGGAFTPPQTPLERLLAGYWERFLLIEPIGRDDDFLALGGTSITALQLVQAASADGLELSVRQIFNRRILKELADFLTERRRDAAPAPNAGADQTAASARLSVDQETLDVIDAQLRGLSS